jgi:hypothetical protein
MTIVNDESRVINKLDASLTDDARVVIYDCHMFIVQSTGQVVTLLLASNNKIDLKFFLRTFYKYQHGRRKN